ncbi:hypothetical protein MSG28_014849 [Choristoneura fumiferana]|uniref:Uncharacterized protein n=1 Tax=Choristoneura fumiferana TaxID=7141 RepID=A0ACC0JSU9_CHOFU|nr:hypothetical protein MSG28_014849 [Choristoneura fumiferana]
MLEAIVHWSPSRHCMAEEILGKADDAVKGYRQLQEPMQIRRDNLEDAALLHRWDRDADEEMRWMVEREPLAALKDTGATLQETQALLKKHLALEAELMAREPTVNAVCGRATALARRGHFAGAALETRARDLAAALAALQAAAAARAARLQARKDLLQVTDTACNTPQAPRSRRAPGTSPPPSPRSRPPPPPAPPACRPARTCYRRRARDARPGPRRRPRRAPGRRRRPRRPPAGPQDLLQVTDTACNTPQAPRSRRAPGTSPRPRRAPGRRRRPRRPPAGPQGPATGAALETRARDLAAALAALQAAAAARAARLQARKDLLQVTDTACNTPQAPRSRRAPGTSPPPSPRSRPPPPPAPPACRPARTCYRRRARDARPGLAAALAALQAAAAARAAACRPARTCYRRRARDARPGPRRRPRRAPGRRRARAARLQARKDLLQVTDTACNTPQAPRSRRAPTSRRPRRAPGRRRRPRARCRPQDLLQLTSDISEVSQLLAGQRAALAAGDCGRDEDSALALRTRLQAQQRELAALRPAIDALKERAQQAERNPEDAEEVKKQMDALQEQYEEMKLLSAKRQQRLEQSLKYFKFVQECSEAQEWISEQMGAAASEEYGLDVEHVDTLQQAFDYFLAQLNANEGRIEAVCEAGNALLEENTPEADRVRQRIDDVRGLWDDLRELALARQEALAGARQVHEFDRAADETVAWIAEKEPALASDGGRSLNELHAQKRRLHALTDDLAAITAAHAKLSDEAERLGSAFPDAREHVASKLEDVSDALRALTARAATGQQQIELAHQLQAYFQTYQDLLWVWIGESAGVESHRAWTNETIAVVTAPELAHDVPGAERLLARHKDIGAEVAAKDDAFQALYSDGEKLVREGHFMSAEIEERMATLRARRAQLDAAWAARADIYAQHLDALVFRREADALDAWITNRVPLVRDGKVGESVGQVEQLLARHTELEQAILAHSDKFQALNRITLVEQAFQKQKESEEAARAASQAQQAAERALRHRRQEVERIAEQRRRDIAPPPRDDQLSSAAPEPSPGAAPAAAAAPAPASSEETLSPAPQFDRLPRNDPVKRAESMSVMKTPKRTPSFTTRRRTQSFRRHRRPDAELPPVEIEGYLERKQESGVGGKRATVRSWRSYYCVLCGQLLCFFRDELDFAAAKAAAPPQAILNARCEAAGDYTKRAHVFRVRCADGAEYLFGCSSAALMRDWVAKLSFHAQLPPELQLTPYAPPESPNAELKRRLQRSASSSSSAQSSPEPARRARTQAEILQEHRDQARTSADRPSLAENASQNTTPERNIESSVLPSLPPRKPPSQEDVSEVVLRNSEQATGSWGRSRFSNGRDLNSEFIRSQRDAADGAPPLPLSGPPDRPPAIPERQPNIPERQPNIPERQPNIPERQTNIPERQPNIPERQPNQVSALVNSYQQRVSRDQNRNMPSAWQNYERQNNNWGVETSHFYSASELAYGGNQRPASVAGSGGSPALDQRPASRSSGESELSVSGVSKEKKDKKGVFGGLFSRKKRPQSHM